MRIGKLNISLGSKEEMAVTDKKPPSTEAAYMHSLLYNIGDFPRYNPDDLQTAKGQGIYKKMLRDEQVKAAARFRRNSVTGRGWSFQFPDDVDLSDEEKERRIRIFTTIVKNVPGSFKRKLDSIMSAMYYGFSLTEKTYKPITIEGTTYWGIKNLRTKPASTFSFKEDEYGELEGIVQTIGTDERELDARRFIHHVYNQDVEEYYGQSELRECYRAYFSKEVIIKFQNIYLERMAGGFVWARPDADTESLPAGSKQETNLKNVLSNLQTKTGIMMPKGYELNVEHPASTDAFEKAIIMYNLAIAKGLLMPNLIGFSEQGPNGSRALGDTQLEAFLWMLDAEAADLAETMNEQLFVEVGDYNFGDGLYPEFTFRPLSQTMIKIVTSLWGDLVQKGAVTRTDSDEAYVRELLGFPEADIDEDGEEEEEGEDPDAEGEEEDPGEEEQPGNEEDDETVIGKGQLALEYDKKKFNRALQRVDFAKIDASSNIAQWQNVQRMGDTFSELTEWVIERLRDTPDLLTDPNELKKLKVRSSDKRKMGKIVRQLLKDGWTIGVDNANQEIDKAAPKRMSREFNARFASIGDIATKYFSAKEFVITGKLLEDYQNLVHNAILNGIKYSKETNVVIEDIVTSLTKKGLIDPDYAQDLLGEALQTNNPRARLETVVRTNMFDAINEARFSYFTDQELGGFVQSLEYSAILDSRTTDICRELDNTVLLAGASEWDRLRPPNHFNCRSVIVAVTERDDIQPTGLSDSVASGDVAPGDGFS